jgi:hypothetical protein
MLAIVRSFEEMVGGGLMGHGGHLMLTLLSARHGLGGTLRRYQHDRPGIIKTVTQSAEFARPQSRSTASASIG